METQTRNGDSYVIVMFYKAAFAKDDTLFHCMLIYTCLAMFAFSASFSREKLSSPHYIETGRDDHSRCPDVRIDDRRQTTKVSGGQSPFPATPCQPPARYPQPPHKDRPMCVSLIALIYYQCRRVHPGTIIRVA